MTNSLVVSSMFFLILVAYSRAGDSDSKEPDETEQASGPGRGWGHGWGHGWRSQPAAGFGCGMFRTPGGGPGRKWGTSGGWNNGGGQGRPGGFGGSGFGRNMSNTTVEDEAITAYNNVISAEEISFATFNIKFDAATNTSSVSVGQAATPGNLEDLSTSLNSENATLALTAFECNNDQENESKKCVQYFFFEFRSKQKRLCVIGRIFAAVKKVMPNIQDRPIVVMGKEAVSEENLRRFCNCTSSTE